MDKKNTLLFVLFAGLVLFGSMFLGEYLWPRKDRPKAHPPVAQGQNPAKGQEKKAAPEKPAPEKPAPEKPAPPPVVEKPAPPARKITPEMLQLVQLGTPGGHLQATLDPRGAGVRQLVANDFQEANSLGRPVWLDEAHKKKKPLELIPQDGNTALASYLLFHYRRPGEDFPVDTLGKRVWTRLEPGKIEKDQMVQRAAFQTTINDILITKTYTLQPRWYHLELEVRLELDPKAKEQTDREFRYQLQGAHALPIEGDYYTYTLRNALIARVDSHNNNVERFFQDLRQISHMGGGTEVVAGKSSLCYAGVAVQYFASVIAVDPRRRTINRRIPTFWTRLGPCCCNRLSGAQ